MRVGFFDSSAIVKRYVSEVGTAWILGLTAPASGTHSYCASIAVQRVTDQ
jgi:predicted nucleic acid-binding protein